MKGAIKKNPGRYRERQAAEAEAEDTRELGDPPPDFLNEQSGKSIALLAIWHRLLEDAPPGCIQRRHRQAFINACRLQYDIDRASPAKPAQHAQMLRYLTSFGMSGEARASGTTAKGAPPPGESEESGWQAFQREEQAERAG